MHDRRLASYLSILAFFAIVSHWSPASGAAANEDGTGVAAIHLTSALKGRLVHQDRISGPALTRPDLDGRVVVVTFFASWCPPCHIEFQHLADLHESYAARGITIVAINYFENFAGFEDNGARLKRFISRHDPPFQVIRGSSEIATAFGQVSRIPTLFVFAADGRPTLHFVHRTGAKKTNADMAELRAAIDRAFETGAGNRSGRGLPAVRQSAVTKP